MLREPSAADTGLNSLCRASLAQDWHWRFRNSTVRSTLRREGSQLLNSSRSVTGGELGWARVCAPVYLRKRWRQREEKEQKHIPRQERTSLHLLPCRWLETSPWLPTQSTYVDSESLTFFHPNSKGLKKWIQHWRVKPFDYWFPDDFGVKNLA